MRTIVPALILSALLLLPASAGSAGRSDASIRSQAVEWAQGQQGHKERGTSNCSSRINGWEKDMGLRIPPCKPWCGALVHQAFLRAGVKLSARMINPDKTYADARAGKNRLRAIPVSEVRRGDVLLFKFRNGHEATHLALASGGASRGFIPTAEGNVGNRAVVTKRAVNTVVLAARVDVD